MPTVVITGAAGAIGSVTAHTFQDAGWDLGLIDYGKENRTRLQQEFPAAHVESCDLTDESATREAIDAIGETTGSVDATLGIAGGFAMQAAAEASREAYDHMMGMNFRTLFNTARAALPQLKDGAPGLLLGVSAPAAEEGGANVGLYAASKAAVAAYLKSLDAELQEEGVRTTVLYPMGVVDTEANRSAMPDGDPDDWIDPEELAEGMLHVATRSSRGHIPELKIYAAS